MTHLPSAPLREHRFHRDDEYLLFVCDECGRRRDGQASGVAPTGQELRHDQRAGGCRGCGRQFTHKLPADLVVAFDQAAFEVGFHAGRSGAPEWRPRTIHWWAENYHLAAYAAGYRAGEAAAEVAAA